MEHRLNLLEEKFNIQAIEMSLMRDELNRLKGEQANPEDTITKPSNEAGWSPESDTIQENNQAMFDTIMKALKEEKAARIELEQKVECERLDRIRLEESIVQQNRSYQDLLEKFEELSEKVQNQQETIKTITHASESDELKETFDEPEETSENQVAGALKDSTAMTSANMESFKEENANIRASLDDLAQKHSSLQTSVTALEQYNVKTRVSFSARVAGNIANVDPWKTVVFNHVITNESGAYSQSSGEFSAPIDGVYVFFAHVMGTNRRALEIVLQVNGGNTMWLYANGLGHGRDANMVVVRLKTGDKVKVVKHGPWGEKPFYVHASWSTFSGFLLY